VTLASLPLPEILKLSDSFKSYVPPAKNNALSDTLKAQILEALIYLLVFQDSSIPTKTANIK
jgi:hypothetical protein